MEQQAQRVIMRLAEKEAYKLAKQLILSKDRWEKQLISDQEFEKTIVFYQNMAIGIKDETKWTQVEKDVAFVLDSAIVDNNKGVKQEMLRSAWLYQNGQIEEMELKQKQMVEFKKLAKQRDQPTLY